MSDTYNDTMAVTDKSQVIYSYFLLFKIGMLWMK